MSKYDSINKMEYGVKYPKKEKAYVFIPHNGIPFESAVVGITYPSKDYKISRAETTKICLFEYVISGEGEVYIDGRWQTASAGDFYILPSGTKHQYRSSANDPWEKIWVNYISGYMPCFLESYGVKGGIYRSHKAKAYFDELIEITKESDPNGETAFRIADRVQKIVRAAASQIGKDQWNDGGLKMAVSSYVYKKFSLDEMAEQMNMSKSNVIRLYKKKHGITPYEDLLKMKIEAAKKLLEETSLPIKEISDKLCIYDEHYFSALFLDRTGKRPGKFRKECL